MYRLVLRLVLCLIPSGLDVHASGHGHDVGPQNQIVESSEEHDAEDMFMEKTVYSTTSG